MTGWRMPIGAEVLPGGKVRFRVWAPLVEELFVQIGSGDAGRAVPLEREANGYFSAVVTDVKPGERYFFQPGQGDPRPDPASRYQPDGVHEPSQVVDPSFAWTDTCWRGVPLADYVIYELHVGTFTPEGTFAAVISRLDYLIDLGITAVELMPVAQFPGTRNWGYDGVYPFAPQASYGGPEGLKRLVDACHGKGLAVILDVVYNHLGPEGNYLRFFGHYFTDHYRTPWGDGLNFDGPWSDEVRGFFIANALYWINEFHVDALRLDAIDRIYDYSANHFMKDLADAVHLQREMLGRRIYLIAESDQNDVRLINPPETGGYGIDAQWNDGFHHAIHAFVTGERAGYYIDFGGFRQIVKAFDEGFVLSGDYSAFRKRRHGNSARERSPSQFVVCSQNHDQIGNRLRCDRLAVSLPLEKLKVVAGLVILSPYLPLLFMGEEYGEKAPFEYFVSYGDRDLIEAVRKGRYEEFAAFAWQGEATDPQAEETFQASKVDIALRERGEHALLFAFYRKLIALRRSVPGLGCAHRREMEITSWPEKNVLALRRQVPGGATLTLFNLDGRIREVVLHPPEGKWEKILDSALPEWGGRGEVDSRPIEAAGEPSAVLLAPCSVVVYRRAD